MEGSSVYRSLDESKRAAIQIAVQALLQLKRGFNRDPDTIGAGDLRGDRKATRQK